MTVRYLSPNPDTEIAGLREMVERVVEETGDAPAWVAVDDRTRFALRVTERVHASRSRFQSIEIVETVAFGRVLVLDGVFQTSERDEHVYHEMLVHPAMLSAPAIASVPLYSAGPWSFWFPKACGIAIGRNAVNSSSSRSGAPWPLDGN